MYSEQLQKNLKREGKSIFAGRPPLHRKEVRAQYDASLQYRISEYAIQNIRICYTGCQIIRICNTEYQNMLYRILEYAIQDVRLLEYAIQNRIRICYTEYQNIYSYMQYKITQIFHAAFLCTDYAIYIIDVQNI